MIMEVEHNLLDLILDLHLRDPEYCMPGNEVSKRLHVMKFTIHPTYAI